MIIHYFKPSLYALWIKHFWEGRNLYRATHAVALGLSFSGLIRRTAPFSRLLHVQLVRRCIQPILTRIPTVHCNIHINIYTIYVYITILYLTFKCIYDRLSDVVVVAREDPV
jgi:hypothetical protein